MMIEMILDFGLILLDSYLLSPVSCLLSPVLSLWHFSFGKREVSLIFYSALTSL